MTLKPRDTIHADDMERYDTFMSQVQDDHFLDMYLEDSRRKVKVDLYQYPSNKIVASELFMPSPNAEQYFQQESKRAREAGFDTEERGWCDEVSE